MNCRKGKSRTWLSDADRELLGLGARQPLRVATQPAPKPPATMPVGELKRGDEIRQGNAWVSVCEAEPGLDGRIRIVVAGPRLLGWLSADQQLQVSPSTAERFEPRRRQLRAVDIIETILSATLPYGEAHDGALAHARNIVAGLDGVPPHEIVGAVAESLEAKGMPRPRAKQTARRIQVAFLMAMKGH